MSEFDQLISYYDDNAWKKYFSIDLAELYRSVKGLLALREELRKGLTSDTVGNLISNSETYKSILLGGFRPDAKQPFTENSLALFYKEAFGIGISDEDRTKIITRLREGDSIEEASLDINVKIEDKLIITRLQKLQAKLELIYTSLRGVVERPEPKNYNPEDPLAGVKALGEVLNAGKKLLPLYNPLSFFIMSTYSVPRFYIKEIYHELFDDKTRQVLEKYGIKIVKLLEPELTNKKLREERQIIGLKRGSVGSYIREVIIDLYDLFQKEILHRFYNNIEDELNKYIDEYINKIRESIIAAQFFNVIDAVKFRGECSEGTSYSCYYSPNIYKSKECKAIIKKYTVCYNKFTARISGGSVNLRRITRSGYIHSTSVNYTEFFACLAPLLFAGLAYIEPVSEDYREFYWMCLLGWESA